MNLFLGIYLITRVIPYMRELQEKVHSREQQRQRGRKQWKDLIMVMSQEDSGSSIRVEIGGADTREEDAKEPRAFLDD